MSDVKSTGKINDTDKANNTDSINDSTGNDLAYPYLALRAHHLLCIPQYQGSGYSEAFCLQMDNVIKMLQEHRRKLVLLCRPDMLCMYCPNLMQENTYLPHLHKEGDAGELLAEQEVGNSRKNGGGHCEKETEIIRKDRTLLEGLHIKEGAAYDAEEIKKSVRQYMTQKLFDRACGDCEWLRRGFCSYGLWKEKFYDTF